VDTNIIEAIGYCGTLATVATYSMRSIVPLRVAGIASSLFFITYAAIMGIWPMLLTEFVILPINCLRLVQVLRTGEAKPQPACQTAS
jgi:CRP/FNR family transcriptional regulator, cyclic AMP receptor protein